MLKGFRNLPCGAHRTCELRRQNGAVIDRNNVVRARGGEADLQNVVRSAARVENGAPPADAMRVDQLRDRRDDIGLRQSLDDKRALPLLVLGKRPVLQRASTTGAEMPADRRGALMASLVDLQQMPSIGMAGDTLDRDGFAG